MAGPTGLAGLTGLTGSTGSTGPTGASPFTLNGTAAVYTAGSVGIGANPPNSSAVLEVASTTKGLLIPRMTLAQRNLILSPATGLLIYQTDSTPGLYQWNGSAWTQVGGTSGTVTSVGLTLPGIFSVTNSPVTTTGTLTGSLVTQSVNTVFAGPTTVSGAPTFRTLVAADVPDLPAAKIASGTLGVARGGTGLSTFAAGDLLYANAIGAPSRLTIGSTGNVLTVSGGLPAWGAASSGPWATINTNDIYASNSGNVGIGTGASAPGYKLDVNGDIRFWAGKAIYSGNSKVLHLGSGSNSILVGTYAGLALTGSEHTVVGVSAAAAAGNSTYLTAIGAEAAKNISGSSNTAIGRLTLSGARLTASTGGYNTAIGTGALAYLASGSDNVTLGSAAGQTLEYGSDNIYVGYFAVPSAAGTSVAPITNEIVLGSQASGKGSNTMLLGNTSITRTFIAGIRGATLGGTTPQTVVIDSNGQLASSSTAGTGTVTSVGLTLPNIFSVTNSPVTTTGTLTGSLASQSANTVFAGPTTGSAAPTFRALVAADVPDHDAAKITSGTLGVARGGTGLSSLSAGDLLYANEIGALSRRGIGSERQVLTVWGGAPVWVAANSGPWSTIGEWDIYSSNVGNVGVGTGATAPAYKLDVNGDIRFRNGSAIYSGTSKILHSGGGLSYSILVGSGAGLALTGYYNTVVGESAAAAAGNSTYLTAIGAEAAKNISGYGNTAVGRLALAGDGSTASTGSSNTAIGGSALERLITGDKNVAIGPGAGWDLKYGSNNLYVGSDINSSAGTSLSPITNEIVIGGGEGRGSNTMMIGNNSTTKTSIKGIRGTTTSTDDAIPVVIDWNGQLGTVSSSIRFKEDVRDLGERSGLIFGLRPVSFRYKGQEGRAHFGLIAEEVDQVIPELAVRGADGQIETVAYHELPPLILAEVQKQQKAIDELRKENEELRRALAEIRALLVDRAK